MPRLSKKELQTRAKMALKFARAIEKIYNEAEVLRDCTELHTEKEVFNATRAALYDLMPKARRLAYTWDHNAKNVYPAHAIFNTSGNGVN